MVPCTLSARLTVVFISRHFLLGCEICLLAVPHAVLLWLLGWWRTNLTIVACMPRKVILTINHFRSEKWLIRILWRECLSYKGIARLHPLQGWMTEKIDTLLASVNEPTFVKPIFYTHVLYTVGNQFRRRYLRTNMCCNDITHNIPWSNYFIILKPSCQCSPRAHRFVVASAQKIGIGGCSCCCSFG